MFFVRLEFIYMGYLPLAYIFNLGWLRIGPPYIYININPVIVQLGPIALRWYGLMYVVAILIGLQAIRGYTRRRGISEETVYRLLWWCIVAGVIGGRLYFVVQQPDLVQNYLMNPIRIIATWEGGMAFYGAIFLVFLTLIWRARAERLNPLVLLDAGVLFGAVGQIFGRFGNLINGDIIGYPSTLPWSTVYQNPASWACPTLCNVPVQPAAGYELLTNLVLLAVMYFVIRHTRRPGVLMLVYLFGYTITQFSIFFTRANDIVSFLGLDWGLKQAQWTSIVVFIVLIPVTFWVLRHSKPVPEGEVVATYGIPQKEAVDEETTEEEEPSTPDDEEADVEDSESQSAESEGTETEVSSTSTADEVSAEATSVEQSTEETPKAEETSETTEVPQENSSI
ncbi:MAG TPA: prolipoprotein diacylglyceryl transferase [Ktedonobacteraceae bacterium]|nr:prolipoprotein diacylglyceryl transferase [Ktedonobacteraceae bacterium]